MAELRRDLAALTDIAAEQGRQLEAHGGQLVMVVDVLAEQRQDINRLAQDTAGLRTDSTDLARRVVDYMQRTVDLTERFDSKLDLVLAEVSSGFSTVHARVDQLAAEVRDIRNHGSRERGVGVRGAAPPVSPLW